MQPATQEPRHYGRLLAILIVVVVLTVALIAVAAIVVRTKAGPQSTPTASAGSTPSGAPTTAAPTTATSPPTPGQTPAPASPFNPGMVAAQSDVLVQKDVVPGLDRCGSKVNYVASSMAGDFGIAYPRTLEGAVAAAANAVAFVNSPAWLIDDQRHNLGPRIMKALPPDENFAPLRASLSVNADAVPVQDGKPVANVSWHRVAYPLYGSFKLLRVDLVKAGGPPEEVFVSWMMPTVQTMAPVTGQGGTIFGWTDIVSYRIYTAVVEWSDQASTWLASVWFDRSSDPGLAGDAAITNLAYETRQRITGPGWCLPADATTDPLPGAIRTRS